LEKIELWEKSGKSCPQASHYFPPIFDKEAAHQNKTTKNDDLIPTSFKLPKTLGIVPIDVEIGGAALLALSR
jgi:hypothetical protein